MTTSRQNMPSLEAHDAPWTEAEMRVQELLRAHEEEPPQELEAKVFREMASAGQRTGTQRGWRTAAVLAVSGVALVAGLWLLDTEVQTDISVPSEQVETAAAVHAQSEASELVPSLSDDRVETAATPQVGVVSVRVSDNANPPDEKAGTLRNLEGLPAAPLEGQASNARMPIEPSEGNITTERRAATLEVKQ